METEKHYRKGADGSWTTKEQWDAYEIERKAHEDHWQAKKPYRTQFATTAEYNKALSEWDMAYHCMAPNKPGYFRANND